MARKQKVVDTLWKGLQGLLKGRKGTTYLGTGTLHPNKTVKVTGGEAGDVEVTADAIILASGSLPRTIPGFDVDGKIVVTSDELLSIEQLPKSAVVVGGGAIGCEFASMMSDLGTKVTILEALPKILPGLDKDVTQMVLRSFKQRGIDVRAGVAVTGHTPNKKGGGTTVQFGDGESIEVDLVVMSVGRRPYAESLGLDGSQTAVAVSEKGFVEVDECCRTAEDGIYAVGDVIATPQLAHVAFAEGIVVIKDILGEDPVPVDYGKVPWCIYCHPEVAFAGHSEESAKEAGFDIVTSKHRYSGNGRALIVGEPDGLVKIIAEKDPTTGNGGRILGVHMVGPWVTEQLGQGYLAVNWEATVDEVAQYIQPHPTMSELFGESVMALTGRSLHG
jgi:dihydrolipoamide dehydrogenase